MPAAVEVVPLGWRILAIGVATVIKPAAPNAQVAQLVEQGTENPFSSGDLPRRQKLTSDQVFSLRVARESGASTYELSDRFGVTTSAVSQVCTGVLYPNAPGPLSRRYAKRHSSLYERLAPLVDRSAGPLKCHPFLGTLDSDGYGSISIDGADFGVHRLVLSRKLGRPLERNEQTRHTCHVRHCVNPGHLIVGSQLDNSRDMVSAGRSLYGERSPGHKLTEAQVIDIRRLFSIDNAHTFASVGKSYGVSGKTIGQIVNGERWKYLNQQSSAFIDVAQIGSAP